MSNSKKIASKRRHRVARNHKQRHDNKVLTVDIETRSSCPVRDSHFGDHQLMMYVSAAGLDSVLIMGGDLIHEPLVHEGSYDLTRAREVMEDHMKKIREAMSPHMDWASLPDARIDHITGRIRPTVNDDDECN